MRSYFSNRQNRVKLSGVTSSWKNAVRGCPQGSSFGPLLWNIFQNDMTYIVNNASLSMCADDHQLYVKGNSVDCVEQLLTNGGQTISKWYKDNFLKGNYDKYNLMLLGRKLSFSTHSFIGHAKNFAVTTSQTIFSLFPRVLCTRIFFRLFLKNK